MNLKDKSELAAIKIHNAAREESPRAKYLAKVAMLPPPPPKHTIAGPQDEAEAREAAKALADHLEEIHRETSTKPFFARLERAGLLEGNIWKGTLRQAGVAACKFEDEFQGKGTKGKNGKEYDPYYQVYTQFSKFGIKVGTLKVYVSDYRDYQKQGIKGAQRYGPHEEEIEVVINALND